MADNPFDKACRFLIKFDPEGVIAWLLNAAPTDFVFRGWLDTRDTPFPGEPDQIRDTVARLEDPEEGLRPWAVPIEFQIAPSPMFGRLLKYLGALWDDLRPDPEPGSRYEVAAVVVNLTGRGQSSHASSWKKLKLHTELGIAERNLVEENAEVELTRVEQGAATRGILLLIVLMQKGDDPAIIEKWKQLATAEPDTRRRATLGALALVLSEAVDRQTIWQDALKEWNVTKSTIVEQWQTEAVIRTQASALLQVLEAKFGSVPADLSDAVNATKDIETLRRWLPLAVHADSIESFRQQAGV
jgi:hypothetical protein